MLLSITILLFVMYIAWNEYRHAREIGAMSKALMSMRGDVLTIRNLAVAAAQRIK